MSVTAAGLEQHELAAYWAAVESADERAALALATSARDRGVPLEDVLQQLVVAAQLRVGELWADNIWTVAREHAATAVGEVVVRGQGADQPPADTGSGTRCRRSSSRPRSAPGGAGSSSSAPARPATS